ncbi:MAG: ribulose-phosphate 3-epimerase [Actinomycetota bacterium]|nr:ribulose-phosphate 3-epimerase [Actinomycetota bacterium]
MPVTYKLAPSILSADFARLGAHVAEVAAQSDLLHVDVMDGHFVPPITIGPVVVKALRKITDLPLECHLMVTDPLGQTDQFAEAGGSSVVMHFEATDDPRGVIKRARELGLGVGIAVNPETPVEEVFPFLDDIDVVNCMTVNPGWAGQAFIPEVLPKIEKARAHIDAGDLDVDISVDGGVNIETGRRCIEAGANVLGAATAIFGQGDPAAAARALRNLFPRS